MSRPHPSHTSLATLYVQILGSANPFPNNPIGGFFPRTQRHTILTQIQPTPVYWPLLRQLI